MFVILSQRVDFESSYEDELFYSYHYPARYKNQLHKGDIFIYYQGNRYDKGQRYYYGVGTIGEILTADGENYYAKLIDCQKFEKKVPIYLPDGGYIEQLGYEELRKSPPWQSSIRPLSQEAYDYIINAAGIQVSLGQGNTESIEALKSKLKAAIRDYYVGGDTSAIYRIERIAATIGRASSVDTQSTRDNQPEAYSPSETPNEKYVHLLEYCKDMKMSYSYKPILILALLHSGDKNGCVTIKNAASYFRAYYSNRRSLGLCVEKKQCIYLKEDVADKQIIANIIANPVKALVDSGYFFYNEETQILSLSPEIWSVVDRSKKAALTRVCNQKLKVYYGD